MNETNLKIGYFILYKNSGNFFGNMIERFQIKEKFSKKDSKYVHIEICVGGNYSINSKLPRVVLTDIIKKHKNQYIKIVKHKIANYEYARKNVAIQCMKRINKFYGLGVIWFICKDAIKRNVFSAIGDFCSELCGYGLWKEYVDYEGYDYEDILPKLYNQLYPADFLNDNYFEVVWEGYIK